MENLVNKLIHKVLFSFFIVFVLPSMMVAQPLSKRQQYVEKYKYIAVKKMLEHGIPASITLAQGILESGAGQSGLARNAHNHFGIKCHKGWQGEGYIMDDDEADECFRKYKDVETSFEDHSRFLMTRDRYAFLFKYKPTEYKKWARGLKKAGYATNPRYADLLIKLIEEENLHKYDKIKDLSELDSYRSIVKVEEKLNQSSSFVEARVDDKVLKLAYVSESKRMVYENNGVKLVKALKYDTYYKIAQEFNLYTWQLRKYNLADKNDIPKHGEWVYLEKKRNKARIKFHYVQEGESLRDISQRYAVKMRKLLRRNKIKDEKQPLLVGKRLRLR